MNTVKISGTLTRTPYFAAKGWVSVNLAVPKEGSDYKVWVSLYAPKGAAADAFDGAEKDDPFTIEGSLDEGKDKDGNKFVQVKVSRSTKGNATPSQRSENLRRAEYIDDSDLPF